jgi:hypothetical protein
MGKEKTTPKSIREEQTEAQEINARLLKRAVKLEVEHFMSFIPRGGLYDLDEVYRGKLKLVLIYLAVKMTYDEDVSPRYLRTLIELYARGVWHRVVKATMGPTLMESSSLLLPYIAQFYGYVKGRQQN